MAQRYRQSIGCIHILYLHTRQLQPYHVIDLRLIGMANTHDRFFNCIWGIFRYAQARLRRHQQRDRARLTQFQRCNRVFINKSLLNSRGDRLPRQHHRPQLLVERKQPQRQIIAF